MKQLLLMILLAPEISFQNFGQRPKLKVGNF